MARKKDSGASSAEGGSQSGASERRPLLERELQRELLAIALLALSVVVLLTLVPISAFGDRVTSGFPSGNVIGPVGGAIENGLWRALGISALLVPPLIALGGLYAGDWLAHGRTTTRLTVLVVGLALLLPSGAYVVARESRGPGWLGAALGGPLVTALSPVGAIILLSMLLSGLTVITLGWRPLRRVSEGLVAAGGAVGRGLAALAARRAARATEAQPAEPVVPEPLPPFERETGLDPGEGEQAAENVATEQAAATSARPERGQRTERAPLPAPAEAESTDPFVDRTDRRALATPLPPIDLLTQGSRPDRSDMEKELDRLGDVLVEKLRTFNVESHVGGRTTGPVVTQFEVVPAPGVKVNRIANLDADLALAMKAQSIRIVAPIPGKGAVGVEIPNPEAEVVQLREILEAREFGGARGELPLALGRDLTGKPYVADLAKMPHVLIAGATGSGKSVCINTIVTSLVFRHTPETLRLLMIDPKMVELSAYADLPHLRHPVVTDPRDAAGVLKWAVLEMEKRYELLSTNHVRSIGEFNKKLDNGVVLKRTQAGGPEGDEDRWVWKDGPLAYVVVVVDELADLMMTVQSEIEKPLAQLAQKARAIGIHLIVATQRPSVNVITGLIKANFPTRVAFRVASKTDSRTILDQNGAESLLGNGDMLFLPPGKSEPARIQGAFIATEETEKLLAWYRARRDALEAEPEVVPSRAEADILEEVRAIEQLDGAGVEEISGDWDDLFRAAAEVCVQHDQGSTSLLQRRLKIGYGRAARIVDQLHDAGVLGPPDGSKPREVLMGMRELDSMFPGA